MAGVRARRAGTAAAIVLLASALLSACGSDAPPEPEGPEVLVVGDSVTVLSSEELRSRFDWAGSVRVEATSGATTEELLDDARDGVGREPDIGVFLVGYNDLRDEDPDPESLADMVALAAELDCAVWFLLPEELGHPRRLARAWNRNVVEQAEAHPSVHVSEQWRDLVDASEPGEYVYRADEIHPNQAGQRALGRLMASEAQARCAPPEADPGG